MHKSTSHSNIVSPYKVLLTKDCRSTGVLTNRVLDAIAIRIHIELECRGFDVVCVVAVDPCTLGNIGLRAFAAELAILSLGTTGFLARIVLLRCQPARVHKVEHGHRKLHGSTLAYAGILSRRSATYRFLPQWHLPRNDRNGTCQMHERSSERSLW